MSLPVKKIPRLLSEQTFSRYLLELLRRDETFCVCLADSVFVPKSLLVVLLDFLEHCSHLLETSSAQHYRVIDICAKLTLFLLFNGNVSQHEVIPVSHAVSCLCVMRNLHKLHVLMLSDKSCLICLCIAGNCYL